MMRADDSRQVKPVSFEEAVDPNAESWRREIRRTFGVLAPWLSSFVFHLGLLILALALVWMVFDPPLDRPTPMGLAEPKIAPSVLTMTRQEIQLQRNVETWPESRASVSVPPADSASLPLKIMPVLHGGPSMPTPHGSTLGRIGGSGFFGLGCWGPPRQTKKPQRIIFLIDASGSLAEAMPFVENELRRTLRQMPDGHPFNVIFFADGQAAEAPLPKPGMKVTDAQTRQAIDDWLDGPQTQPRGKTDPRAAIRLAMGQKPDVLVILSDNITGGGRFEIDRAQMLAFLDEIEGKRPVIHTIQFLQPDPMRTLEVIARRHGGSHKYIDIKDLGVSR